jgi:1-deoxy-D-xylulose-5-phosphate synthase
MPARRFRRPWGLRPGRDLGSDENVVAIFGDAALTNGISFEALNNIAHTTKRFIGILNDNEWSIAKNVGAIATYLNRLITHPSYNRLQKDLERLLRNACPRVTSPSNSVTRPRKPSRARS